MNKVLCVLAVLGMAGMATAANDWTGGGDGTTFGQGANWDDSRKRNMGRGGKSCAKFSASATEHHDGLGGGTQRRFGQLAHRLICHLLDR